MTPKQPAESERAIRLIDALLASWELRRPGDHYYVRAMSARVAVSKAIARLLYLPAIIALILWLGYHALWLKPLW